MKIHTIENESYNLDSLPDEIDDLRFAILDNSKPKDPDYFFTQLIFLENFISPALVLKIGDAVIKMPRDWHILIGEEDMGDLEALPLTSINDRDFNAYEFNCLLNRSPTFLPIEVVDIYNEVSWYCPKLKNGQY